MIELVTSQLRKEKPSDWHDKLLNHALALSKMSRSRMSEYYSDWDLQDQVYRGERKFDAADKKAANKDEPTKMVVPHTFAQVMTFTSFVFLLLTQNKTFFELVPTGNEDHGDKHKDMELLLERNIRHNKRNQLLFQSLLDITRFGLGVTECSWTKETVRANILQDPTAVSYGGGFETTLYEGSGWQEFVKYEGNLVRSISPYKFLPDLRFNLKDFQRGEFCGAEEEYSVAALKELEKAGEVAGVDFIKPLPVNWQKNRGITRTTAAFDRKYVDSFKPTDQKAPVLVTKMQIRLVPKQFTLDGKTPLGPEDFPVLYHVWYANDNRLIRCEPAGWWHGEFGWQIGQFTPDMHKTVTLGLADLIYRLQDVMSWFVNSHVASVRKIMRGRLIVNPAVVDMKSFDGDNHIYLKQGTNPMLAERAITQLGVMDTTSNHMNDMAVLSQLMQIVTGVNDNAMGQYNGGRRSATEARNVSAGAAGRMKMHAHLIWEQMFDTLGHQMLSNLRQELSMDFFSKIVGQGKVDPMTGQSNIEQRYAAFKGTPEEVICSSDYFTFDSTLQSEKGFVAQSLQELLVAIISNPMAAQSLNLSPQKMLGEIQFLRGAGDVARFSLTPEEQMQMQMQYEQARLASTAQGS
jgi:hypothetical protein